VGCLLTARAEVWRSGIAEHSLDRSVPLSLQIVELGENHLADASALVGARYAALRAQVPSLPARYQDPALILPRLRALAARVPGVAAIRAGRLAGFLLAFTIPSFRGRRSAYSPEWANAAELEDSRRIYEALYAHLAGRWVVNGCYTHLVGILAHDRPAIEGWHGLGFGMCAADGVRSLEGVAGDAVDLQIRRAGLGDLEQVMALSEALQRHLAAAPTLLAYVDKESRARHERWLADPAYAMWLACRGSQVVAMMVQGPANPDACDSIQDKGTSSIVGAFTVQRERGRGVGTALLGRALAWARGEGYARCAVDFEPMNVLAARFWMRHFAPVCWTLIRQVDPRIAWAGAGRKDADLW
jgi:GNAT superfamily N-acetyltransferase